MKNFVARFAKDESGATAIEYGLIAALITVGIIAAATTLGCRRSSPTSRTAWTIRPTARNKSYKLTGAAPISGRRFLCCTQN